MKHPMYYKDLDEKVIMHNNQRLRIINIMPHVITDDNFYVKMMYIYIQVIKNPGKLNIIVKISRTS